ncbi:MAG: amidohydrolase family protein [Chitinophagaceae bacterium]|nr:amidohydrolase family protein [Chitinophagaceae bacterium]
MNKLYLVIIAILTSIVTFSQTIRLTNGNYFQDGRFKHYANVYIKDGKFTFIKPKVIDTTINLENKFIIPPFAEGHTHKIDNPKEVGPDINAFVKQGVFYAFVLNNFSSNVKSNRNELLNSKKIEVAFANGGITVTGQHPSFVYERIISDIKEWWLPENTAKIKNSRKGENDAYWFMDNIEEVDKKWEAYLKTKPDVVKVYLMNVNKNETQNPKTLSENTVSYIVKKAKASNLRVVAHIESLDDLKVGLRCGISIFGHMPHYNVNFSKELPADFQFTELEKKIIKKLRPVIIPTLSFNDEFSIVRNEKNNYQGELDTASFNRSLRFQKTAIKSLHQNGFKFAIGSDREYFMSELLYWFKNNFFSYEDILTIATKETPKLIFPTRKLGEFKEGFEASFLVLNQDPLKNIQALKSIELLIKQGKLIVAK